MAKVCTINNGFDARIFFSNLSDYVNCPVGRAIINNKDVPPVICVFHLAAHGRH